jgi:hypothetical protein
MSQLIALNAKRKQAILTPLQPKLLMGAGEFRRNV